MDPIDLEQSVADLALLSRQAVTAAQLASELLERELAGPADVKRAKDLSGIFKDMALLARELGGAAPQALTVRFAEDAEAAAR